jgi:hypothetical protein
MSLAEGDSKRRTGCGKGSALKAGTVAVIIDAGCPCPSTC